MHNRFNKEGSIILCNSQSGVLVCGSSAGEVAVYTVQEDGSIETFFSKGIHAGPVVAAAFNADGSCLFTSGSDGSFFMHNKITKLSPYEPILSSYEYDYLITVKYQRNRKRFRPGRELLGSKR
eukprot:13981485-Ditylum_brightwellii.AAC.1